MALAEHLLPIVEDVHEYQTDYKMLPDKVTHLSVDIDYFSYGDLEKRLLRGINFEISSKNILLIKGNSGAGKSTLLDIVMGFLSSDTVKVLQNNVNCANVSKTELWSHTLIVSQEALLLEGSLRENLFLGESFPIELLDDVIFTVCLEDYVKEHGLDKIIGGENEGVSGGQKQRINIARVLLRRPDILILDEPTSALDTQTSLQLSKRITSFVKKYDMILIVVSHKADFDNYATKILEVKD